MGNYRILAAADYYGVTDAIVQAGEGARVHFFGSFADCWAWIQYQEYVK